MARVSAADYVVAFDAIPEKELRGLAREAMGIIRDIDYTSTVSPAQPLTTQQVKVIRYFLQRFGPVVRKHLPLPLTEDTKEKA